MLRELATDENNPYARVHALSILAVTGQLTADDLMSALQDEHPGVLLVAIRLSEPLVQTHPELLTRLEHLAGHADPSVVLSVALRARRNRQPGGRRDSGQHRDPTQS